jgi:hypothetical protein
MSFDLFIDTNIYLSFFELTKGDNDTLGDTFLLNVEEEFHLLCTTQVVDEFRRMWPKVISNSLKTLREIRVPAIPTMASDLDEVQEYQKSRNVIFSNHDALVKALEMKIEKKELSADILMKRIFSKAKMLAATPTTMQAARDRLDCGNPPGKKGSLGDAINWELLLNMKTTERDLILISQDSDYIDPLTGGLSSYLSTEWMKSHHGKKILLYKNLQSFLTAHFPDIGITPFSLIDEKVARLAGSASFEQTHAAISELSAIEFFSTKQVNYLVKILSQNNQIYWILSDAEVRDFFDSLYERFNTKLGFFENQYIKEMLD